MSHLTREDRLRLRAEAELSRIRIRQLDDRLIQLASKEAEVEAGWPTPVRWWRLRQLCRQQDVLEAHFYAQLTRLMALQEAWPRA